MAERSRSRSVSFGVSQLYLWDDYGINSTDLLMAVANPTNADANYGNEHTDPTAATLDLENQSIVLVAEMANPGNALTDLVAEAFDLENVSTDFAMAMTNQANESANAGNCETDSVILMTDPGNESWVATAFFIEISLLGNLWRFSRLP